MLKSEYLIAARHFKIPVDKPFNRMTEQERVNVRMMLDVTGYPFTSPAAFVVELRKRLGYPGADKAPGEARQAVQRQAAQEARQRREEALQRAKDAARLFMVPGAPDRIRGRR